MSRKTAKQARVHRQRAQARLVRQVRARDVDPVELDDATVRRLAPLPRPRRPTAWQRRDAAARKQRRTTAIVLGTGGALLAAIVGYGIYDESRRSCVDTRNQTVVDASQCNSTHGGGASGIYRWYYGGARGGLGQKVTGGSYERGGFGRFVGHIGS